MKDVSYASGAVPPDYRCASCGAHGVKLWRLGYTMDPELFCVGCTEARAKERLETGREASDQIGGYLPAVPDEEGAGFWGYTSVPPAGVAWWKALPLALPRPAANLARRIIGMLRDAAKTAEHIPVEFGENSPMRHQYIGRLAAWREALYRAELLEREAQTERPAWKFGPLHGPAEVVRPVLPSESAKAAARDVVPRPYLVDGEWHAIASDGRRLAISARVFESDAERDADEAVELLVRLIGQAQPATDTDSLRAFARSFLPEPHVATDPAGRLVWGTVSVKPNEPGLRLGLRWTREEAAEAREDAVDRMVSELGAVARGVLTDADIAREFFRRFAPERVLFGAWDVYASSERDGWRSGTRKAGDAVGHPAGEEGFVAAMKRARELVRKGGG